MEDIKHLTRILQRITQFFIFNSEEKILEDLISIKNILKTKDKLRILCEKICQNFESFVYFVKEKENIEKFQERKRFLHCYPLEKLNSFFDELFLESDFDNMSMIKKNLSSLMIFYSYFHNENIELVYNFIETNLKRLSLEDLSKEAYREFVCKYLNLTFKTKRFILFQLMLKHLFVHFDDLKIDKIPKVYEFFFEVISKQLKSMNKTDVIDFEKEEDLRKKFIFICDLITRFTHQLDMMHFYSKDLSIKKFIRIEEIFTRQVK